MGFPPVIVAVSGASGAILAQRSIETLLARQRDVIAVCTPAGAVVWQHELGGSFKRWIGGTGCRTYAINDVAAPIASGTFPTGGMVVVPCSMNSVAAIAHGLSGNLLERAADVTLKERRRLVVVPRETPLSTLHLRNLLTLSELGVTVLPPMPHFYARPSLVEEVVDYMVERILVALDVQCAMPPQHQYGEGVR